MPSVGAIRVRYAAGILFGATRGAVAGRGRPRSPSNGLRNRRVGAERYRRRTDRGRLLLSKCVTSKCWEKRRGRTCRGHAPKPSQNDV